MDALLFGYGQVWHMGGAPPFTRPCRGVSSSTMASRSAHHGGGGDGMRRREGDTERGNVTRRNILNSEVLTHVHTSVEKNIRHTALMLNLTLSPCPSTASHPVPLALGLFLPAPPPTVSVSVSVLDYLQQARDSKASRVSSPPTTPALSRTETRRLQRLHHAIRQTSRCSFCRPDSTASLQTGNF